jgi:hypothetical protein
LENPHLTDTTYGISTVTVSLIAVSSLVSSEDKGFVEYLLEPAMYFCLQIIFMKVWNPMKLWQ